MMYCLRDGFSSKKGVISNTHGFLQTYLDGGFKEKWSGYWSPSHKYLDYFAVKINGVWLTENTLKETRYGKDIVYIHQTSDLVIEQTVSTPPDLTGFKIQWIVKNDSNYPKAVKTSLEAGIDIRSKIKDVESSSYDLEFYESSLKASRNSKWLRISGDDFQFVRDEYLKEHFPGERQECLVPGEISCKKEINGSSKQKFELVFRTNGEPVKSVESFENSLNHEKLGRTFNYCVKSLENLIYRKNSTGIIAGHPWFQNYWARDSFWTVLGIIDAGMFEEAEKILLNFAENKEIPSMIKTDGGIDTEHPRDDTIPLFAIAAHQLNQYYDADKRIISKAEDLLKKNRPKKRIVDNHRCGTWMDTLERGKAVEIQSLWIEALQRFDKGTKRLEKGLEEFKEKDYMKDNLEDNFESINPAIPLMFGQIPDSDAEKYLEKINGEFSSCFGARTQSATDTGYNSQGYHTGSVWGLTTCWAAAANFQYNQCKHGLNFLEKMTQFLDRNQLGALPEVVNAENGENIGCSEQAWTAALFIHIIDRYLLGIQVEENKIVINPIDGISLERRSKRIRDQTVDIKVNNGEVEVLNNPDLNIHLKSSEKTSKQ